MARSEEFERFLEKLNSAADIVTVVSKYLPLTQKGKTFWGCCPFHTERTPSFALNVQENYFHCFGCGESGSPITFVMKYENLDFIKAVELLAKQFNIEMPVFKNDEKYENRKKEKEQIFLANKTAARFYYSILMSERGKTGLDYLTKRGLTIATIKKWGLGYSPDFNSSLNHLRQNGFDNELLISATLAGKSEKNHIYDFFGERVMFPFINTYGDVVGFSGRTLKGDAQIMKYKNTGDTLVFKKSDELFGINIFKNEQKQFGLKRMILVEGQLDAITLNQAGIYGVCASGGTAFPEPRIKLIKRFVDELIICFDGDNAGKKAAIKATKLLMNSGINVKICLMPKGDDPDSFVRKNGKDEFIKIIDSAENSIEFLIKQIAAEFDLKDKPQNIKFMKQSIEEIALLDEVDRDVYLKLIKDLSGANIDILRREINAISEKQKADIKNRRVQLSQEVEEMRDDFLDGEFNNDNDKSNQNINENNDINNFSGGEMEAPPEDMAPPEMEAPPEFDEINGGDISNARTLNNNNVSNGSVANKNNIANSFEELPKNIQKAEEFVAACFAHKKPFVKNERATLIMQNENFRFFDRRYNELYEMTKKENFILSLIFDTNLLDKNQKKVIMNQDFASDAEKFFVDCLKLMVNYEIDQKILKLTNKLINASKNLNDSLTNEEKLKISIDLQNLMKQKIK